MEHNRIQKLLLSEYCDFSDIVLVESPFAQTTRDGHGLREVALGLTPSKLVVAADIFNKNSEFICPPDLDPSIESFELVSVYPLECVALSIFRRRRRRTLKARFSGPAMCIRQCAWTRTCCTGQRMVHPTRWILTGSRPQLSREARIRMALNRSESTSCWVYRTLTRVYTISDPRANASRLIDGRANYYELGGMERRGMFWTLWCERIQSIIAEKGNGSSLSETTAASSSSASTLYLLSSEIEMDERVRKHGNRSTCRVWARYGGAGDGLIVPSWPQKDLFLGPSHDQLGYGHYTPVPVRFAGASLDDLRTELNGQKPAEKRLTKRGCYSWPVGQDCRTGPTCHRSDGLCDVLFTRDKNLGPCNLDFAQGIRADGLWSTEFADDSGDPNISSRVPRREKEKSYAIPGGLAKMLGAQTTTQKIINLAPKISRFGFGIRENCRSGLFLEPYGSKQPKMDPPQDPYKLVESGVVVWEGGERRKEQRRTSRTSGRHPRRYGIATAAHFLHALGPWSVQPGERVSVQGRRSLSAVGIRRQAPDPELRLPVSRRQLAASVSATALEPGRCGAMGAATRGRVVLFWTPEYWYRPRAASAAYKELRQHLALLRDFRSDKEQRCGGMNCRNFFTRRKIDAGDSRVLGRIFSSHGNGLQAWKRKKNRDGLQVGGGTTSQLRRLLKMDLRVSAWDLDSTTIAHQLTLVDRDLFLRIPPLEMEIVVFQRSSRNAPNLGAWIAFSHRISCLMASEILTVKKVESRARLVARMINAAKKCHAAGNFHSSRSILAGLQSPPIYRLKATWAHLRVHHATKYQAMERLSKIYRSPRTNKYRRMWARVELNQPAMPYVGDLLVRLLGINCECGRVSAAPVARINATASCLKPYSDEACVDLEKPRVSLARRILSAAIVKLKSGKTSSSPFSTVQGIQGEEVGGWNARQRAVAQMAYKRWRNYVMEVKIVAMENDERLRNMDERRKRVVEVASWLSECQRSAQNYAYPGHSLAWEFLLKARYKEDRENFFVSLKLEPPSI